MRPLRIAPALALGALGFALLAPASAPARAEDAKAADKADRGKSRTLADLNAAYAKEHAALDRRQLADLADLARRQEGSEADHTYHQLFNTAIARDEYEPAAPAAAAYEGSDAELRGLAAFIAAVHEANRDKYPEALKALDRFLKGQAAGKKLDPNTTFAVGEAFLQRLIHAGRYDEARRACDLFLRDDADPAVKEHFAARLARINLLEKPAPPIAAEDVDGRPASLADYRGKVVLVDFWATWCPPCAADAQTFRNLYDRYHAKGFEILGVNLDAGRQGTRDAARTQAAVRQFLLQYRIPWANVPNGTGAADFAKAYGVSDLPTNFLIDRDGKVLQVEQSGAALEKAIGGALGEDRAGKGGK